MSWQLLLYINLAAGTIRELLNKKISNTVSLFQSYSILVTILLSAVFLGESKYFDIRTFSGIKVVSGTILAFLALWFLLHQKNKKEERLEKKWFYYIAGTILFLGIGSSVCFFFF